MGVDNQRFDYERDEYPLSAQREKDEGREKPGHMDQASLLE